MERTDTKIITSNGILRKRIILFLYTMYFIMKPFYLWSSGLPQISDIILVVLIVISTIMNGFKLQFQSDSKKFLLIGLIFVSYVFIANSFWAMFTNKTDRFLLNSLFYLYNYLVVILIVGLYAIYKERLIKTTYKALLLSVIIQFLLFIIKGGFTGTRMVAEFNNPNQLGYYSLLVLSLLFLLSRKINVNFIWFIIGVFSSLLLAFTSLSKAAILSAVGLTVFYIFSKNKNKKFRRSLKFFILISTVTILLIANFTSVIQDSTLFQSVKKRIASIGKESDDNLDARGYYRLTDYPEYWILGAGEGNYSRFRNHRIEFHSTLGNIQLSYGLIGLMLFLYLIFLALRIDKYKSWYIIMFIMVFGLTHNGIRNSLFWILLALLSIKLPTENISCAKDSKR